MKTSSFIHLLLAIAVMVWGGPAVADDGPVVEEILQVLKDRGLVDEDEYQRLAAKNAKYEAEEKNTRVEEAQGRQKDITDEIATAIDRDVAGAIDGLREEIDTSNDGLKTGLDYLNNYEEVIDRINGSTINVNVRATEADAFTEYIFNGTGP